MEAILANDLKEHGTFMLPALATFFRRQLPAREAVEGKVVCGRLVHIPARGPIHKIKTVEGWNHDLDWESARTP